MADVLRNSVAFSGSVGNGLKKTVVGVSYSPPGFLRFPAASTLFSSLSKSKRADSEERVFKNTAGFSVQAQASPCISKALRWWEKNLKPNMTAINSAQQLVDFLLNAGDKLVIVDFYSPGCGGCKALHPKISQLAEMNPNMHFLQVNYEEHKPMCYSLNVHVLPFFRFYRGAQGLLCSFSCTNATIKKFKDALAKHSTDRCSLGPAKGLEESELFSLASSREVSFVFPQTQVQTDDLATEDNKMATTLAI